MHCGSGDLIVSTTSSHLSPTGGASSWKSTGTAPCRASPGGHHQMPGRLGAWAPQIPLRCPARRHQIRWVILRHQLDKAVFHEDLKVDRAQHWAISDAPSPCLSGTATALAPKRVAERNRGAPMSVRLDLMGIAFGEDRRDGVDSGAGTCVAGATPARRPSARPDVRWRRASDLPRDGEAPLRPSARTGLGQSAQLSEGRRKCVDFPAHHAHEQHVGERATADNLVHGKLRLNELRPPRHTNRPDRSRTQGRAIRLGPDLFVAALEQFKADPDGDADGQRTVEGRVVGIVHVKLRQLYELGPDSSRRRLLGQPSLGQLVQPPRDLRAGRRRECRQHRQRQPAQPTITRRVPTSDVFTVAVSLQSRRCLVCPITVSRGHHRHDVRPIVLREGPFRWFEMMQPWKVHSRCSRCGPKMPLLQRCAAWAFGGRADLHAAQRGSAGRCSACRSRPTSASHLVKFTINLSVANRTLWSELREWQHYGLGVRPSASVRSPGQMMKRIGNAFPDRQNKWWSVTADASPQELTALLIDVETAVRIRTANSARCSKPAPMTACKTGVNSIQRLGPAPLT